jgi:hypothetical protein
MSKKSIEDEIARLESELAGGNDPEEIDASEDISDDELLNEDLDDPLLDQFETMLNQGSKKKPSKPSTKPKISKKNSKTTVETKSSSLLNSVSSSPELNNRLNVLESSLQTINNNISQIFDILKNLTEHLTNKPIATEMEAIKHQPEQKSVQKSLSNSNSPLPSPAIPLETKQPASNPPLGSAIPSQTTKKTKVSKEMLKEIALFIIKRAKKNKDIELKDFLSKLPASWGFTKSSLQNICEKIVEKRNISAVVSVDAIEFI